MTPYTLMSKDFGIHSQNFILTANSKYLSSWFLPCLSLNLLNWELTKFIKRKYIVTFTHLPMAHLGMILCLGRESSSLWLESACWAQRNPLLLDFVVEHRNLKICYFILSLNLTDHLTILCSNWATLYRNIFFSAINYSFAFIFWSKNVFDDFILKFGQNALNLRFHRNLMWLLQ